MEPTTITCPLWHAFIYCGDSATITNMGFDTENVNASFPQRRLHSEKTLVNDKKILDLIVGRLILDL